MCCLCLLFVSVLFVSAVVDVCLLSFPVIVRGIVCQLVLLGSLAKTWCLLGFPGARGRKASELLLVCSRQVVRRKNGKVAVFCEGPRDNDYGAHFTRAQTGS